MTPFDIDPSIVPVPYSLSLIPSAPLRPLTLAHCELDRRAQQQQGQGGDRNNRTFYIRGHPDAVEQCKRIICEKVGMPSPQQQPQQQVAINPSTGQPDYSQQWIDYYRSLGLNREAEAIEQQAKQQQQARTTARSGPSYYRSIGKIKEAEAIEQQIKMKDYSAQWAEYYRSIRKIKEAEAIEQQIKIKRTAGPPAVSWRAARVLYRTATLSLTNSSIFDGRSAKDSVASPQDSSPQRWEVPKYG
ncbi:hypothetical protein NE865_14606 [Phthorimaea operculella]|nr:hypothetical protein NE865_14606 [Phthorimaea operculella]